MNIVAEALGSYYHYKGIFCRVDGDNRGAMELFAMAIEKYEEALGSNPTNKQLLRLCALCWERLSELQMSRGSNLEEVKFSLSDPRIEKTDQYYIRAVEADKQDAVTLYSYAKFLWRCNRVERAEELFLQSLEANPNDTSCLRDYAKFLAACGETAQCERLSHLATVICKDRATVRDRKASTPSA
jgi:tetratricopeptide (TPR) repeat protein